MGPTKSLKLPWNSYDNAHECSKNDILIRFATFYCNMLEYKLHNVTALQIQHQKLALQSHITALIRPSEVTIIECPMLHFLLILFVYILYIMCSQSLKICLSVST